MKNLKTQEVWSVENTPFLFQYDYYRIGNTFLHSGEYLHPVNGLYKYPLRLGEIPAGWRFCFSDIEQSTERNVRNLSGYLKPVDLFSNLGKCKLEYKFSLNVEEVKKTLEVVEHRNEPEYEITPICDGGYESTNVYIYRENLRLYQRHTLKHSGEITLQCKSNAINELLKEIGFEKNHVW